MDGEQRKKRRLDVLKEEEEEEGEEAKMEKFYELIRMTRDIRARMMKISGERKKLAAEEEGEKKKKKKKKNVEKEKPSVGVGVWNPTFQLEDFLEDDDRLQFQVMKNNSIPTAAPSYNFRKQVAAADGGEGRGDHNNNNNNNDNCLDLNLSL